MKPYSEIWAIADDVQRQAQKLKNKVFGYVINQLNLKNEDVGLEDLDRIFKSLRNLEDVVHEAIINLRKEETQNEKL